MLLSKKHQPHKPSYRGGKPVQRVCCADFLKLSEQPLSAAVDSHSSATGQLTHRYVEIQPLTLIETSSLEESLYTLMGLLPI